MSSADPVASSALPARRAWLQLARVSNTPTTISNSVAGAIVVSTTASAITVAVVAVAIALFYTAGMILNDVLDYEVDRRERPERPLPSGQVSRNAAVVAVVVLFVTGAGLLALEGSATFVAGLTLIGVIVLYDAWHKTNPLSPLLMATCRGLVYVVAGLAAAGTLTGELWGAAALLFVYVVGLTQVAKVEGRGSAARWPIVGLLAPVAYWAKELPSLEVSALIAAFALWVAYALWLVTRRRIGAGVARLIAGIALYDALVVAGTRGSAVAVAVCLAAFVATSALQTRITGT